MNKTLGKREKRRVYTNRVVELRVKLLIPGVARLRDSLTISDGIKKKKRGRNRDFRLFLFFFYTTIHTPNVCVIRVFNTFHRCSCEFLNSTQSTMYIESIYVCMEVHLSLTCACLNLTPHTYTANLRRGLWSRY